MTATRRLILAAALGLLSAAGAASDTGQGRRRDEERAACADVEPLRRPYFGDLHVHTRYSLDASTQGTRTTPTQAYDFARGAPLGIQPWDSDSDAGRPLRTVRLERPLDFAAVTDHAEFFGETTLCRTPGLPGYDSLMCRVYRTWPRLAFFMMNGRSRPYAMCGENQQNCRDADSLPWLDMQQAAEAAYDRTAACSFTTFVGYEWTGYTHRNVIFRSDAVPEFAPSALEYPRETDLWDVLEEKCRGEKAGCDFVVIPHNSNVSAGTTFLTERPDGTRMTAAEARRRAANEPLVEIMQHKGSSECFANAEDELCGFENVPYDQLGARFVTWLRKPPAAINFTRAGLGIGLLEWQRLGANPFQFGFIASTDTHLGTPGLTAEDDYPGHGGAGVPARLRLADALVDPIEYNPGGLAVLWAEENSRDSLFAAMQRREAYATSGPRILFRLFAGWDYPADLCGRGDFAEVGYAGGVPMGGVLPAPRAGAAPVIAARALMDAGSAAAPGIPLQRLQIVKLWVEDGAVRERVIDVAAAVDAERPASVDTQTCEPAPAGAAELCAVWQDPDFDPDTPAVYYGRAVQDPTCRWSTHACNQAGIRCTNEQSPSDDHIVRRGWEACCDESVPKTVQERAWTSPIWYTPEA